MTLRSALLLALAVISLAPPVWAEDITRLGGDLTSLEPSSVALELPSPNIRKDRFEYHLLGHGDFHGLFDGLEVNNKFVLGPRFNNISCGGCHTKNGRGEIHFYNSEDGSSLILKVALKGLNRDGTPRAVPGIGEQLQDHTLDGKAHYNIRLTYEEIRGRYADNSEYVLQRPSVNFELPGVDRSTLVTSLRMTPPVIGMGLLEAVPETLIESMADPQDLNGDGISGKVNRVLDVKTGKKVIGRFGFKATHPSVIQQSAAAFFNDMGLTTELFKDESGITEISTEILDRTVFYLQAAGIPPARDQGNARVTMGKVLFQELKCDGCHKMTLQTGASPVPEVANQTIHPFTDLLLHDMGPELADERAEFDAIGSEWRTAPLWGLGLHQYLSIKPPGYLHDGRARTVEEAILWHGGEAARSRDAFKALKEVDRIRLLRFLESL